MEKNADLNFNISATANQSIASNIRFSTQDEGSAKLTFFLFKDGVELPLNAAVGKLVMRMRDGSKFTDNVSIIDKVNGIAEYKLTAEQLKHYGKVTAELYLYYEEQKMSVHRFTFTILQALIDEDIPVLTEFYIDDFEGLKEAINSIADETTEIINTVGVNVEEAKGKADEAITLIEQNQVVKLTEFNENKQQVTAQLAIEKQQVTAERNSRAVNLLYEYQLDPNAAEDISVKLNEALASGYKKFVLPDGLYLLTGRVFGQPGIEIKGIRDGFNMAPSTLISNGPNRIYEHDGPKILIIPDDLENPTFNFDENVTFSGIDLFYPEQLPTFTDKSQLKIYPPTISAKDGFSFSKVQHWGATDFLKATGEKIHIEKIYGYNFGTTFHLKYSKDVSYIKDIHINMNIVRPLKEQQSFNLSNDNSVVILLEDCDGVFIDNAHSIFTRKFIRCIGKGGANSFALGKAWIDWVGTLFEIEGTLNMGININQVQAVLGYSDNPDDSGVLVVKGDSPSVQTTINLTDVRALVGNGANFADYTVPNFAIKINPLSNFIVNCNGVEIYGCKDLVSSSRYNVIRGSINDGTKKYNIETTSNKGNHLLNSNRFILNADGIPKHWGYIDNPNPGIYTSITSLGRLKIQNIASSVPAYKGLAQRAIISPGEYIFYIKGIRLNSRSKIHVMTYDLSDWSNSKEYYANVLNSGLATIKFTVTKQSYVDCRISAGDQLDDTIEVDYAVLSQNSAIGNIPLESNFMNIFDQEKLTAAAPPNVGTYQKGQIVFNSNPAIDDWIGWYCVVAGTPGIWNGFGKTQTGG
ncbi:phage baseplate upper protein [Niallia sp. RD1]|uniref:phage baseplate upper protein n=1 Tax=Niallia sp. RD1 TaxID=2962858 RepID=UPI0020C18EA3|nr:phage baseplate upper protein [Niallia sp. RD1]UTI42094.1 phage baseplate upper protein [Niallia sp. RD1]